MGSPVHEQLGDHVEAARFLREGLRMAEELGVWSEVAARIAGLAWIAVQRYDYLLAADLARRANRPAGEPGTGSERSSPGSA